MRMPNDLRQALTEIAAREQRSLTAQMLYMLRRAVEEDAKATIRN